MLTSSSNAQTVSQTSRNNAFLEFFGNGGNYSVNYERLVGERFGLRVGFAKWRFRDFSGRSDNSITTIPVMANFLIGKRKSKLELGTGFLFGRQVGPAVNGSAPFVNLTGVVGYRYQPYNPGFMFRIGATPFYAFEEENYTFPTPGFLMSFGLSVGYSF
jgi:hypothetical protein